MTGIYVASNTGNFLKRSVSGNNHKNLPRNCPNAGKEAMPMIVLMIR